MAERRPLVTIGGRTQELPANDTLPVETPEVGEVRTFRFPPASAKWLELDGSTLNFDDYPELGSRYGASPGGTFTLDDPRGRALYAADGDNPNGTATGTNVRNLTHSHSAGNLAVGSPSNTVEVDGPDFLQGTETVAEQDHTHELSGSTGDALNAVNIRPARWYVGVYIRALP